MLRIFFFLTIILSVQVYADIAVPSNQLNKVNRYPAAVTVKLNPASIDATKADATNAADKKLAAPKIIFLGDSLTEGYGVAQDAAFPQLIQKKVKDDKKDWTVIGAGSSGSTSASTLSRLKWIAKEKPDVIFILMGSNDGLRGMKVDQTEKNLSDAIDYGKKQNIKIILGQLHVPPNYGKEYAKQFADMFPRLAKKHQIKLGPFLLDKVAGDPKLNQPDAIHPNEKGHQIIADNIYAFLKKEIR